MKKANDALLAELATRGVPKVGDKLPAFSLNNQNGEAVSSDTLLQDGPLIISFFRGVWCPYCNIEVKALPGNNQQ
ncbi:MAG: redoxin domain-containing protein [Pseudomonadota bacterium]